MKTFLGRAWRRSNRAVSRAWLNTKVSPSNIVLEKYGNRAEAWYVAADIAPGAIAYCGGVGRDASYDFALVEQKHLQVYSFDPTPNAIAYMEKENQGRVDYRPWGLLDSDRTITFYAPFNPAHSSWFAENLHGTSTSVDAQCFTIKTVMEKLGHDHIDLLKIDIEGSWHAVLTQMIADSIFPDMICVEFDSPAPINRVYAVAKGLFRNGYKLVLREFDNAVFVRQQAG